MRKTIIFIITIVTVALMLFSLSFLSFGEGIKSSMNGNEILRAGDTLEVVYSVEDVHCYGFQGYITYNSEIMTLVSTKALQSNWVIELLGEGKFIAYSKTPVDESTEFQGGEIFEFHFLISEEANAGDEALLSFTEVKATDTQEETLVADAHYSEKISPPKSSDASISALFITNASYSPAFSPEVTEYTIPMGVGYDITSLDIDVVTNHEKAVYTIEGNDLRVGNNRVTIKVTAEDGSEKEYVITLKRAHSPTDKLSDNTRLSELTVSSGTLSPEFSPEIREYVIYLSNEVRNFSAYGRAEDEFAKEVNNAEQELTEGINRITVSCRAEDGTIGEYVIFAVVMPKYIGIIPDIQNSIPLTGSLYILGEYTIGSTLTATIAEGYDEASYTVNWYRNSEHVATGNNYTLSDDDRESIITVILTGDGVFSGSFKTSITVLENGEVYLTDGYIPSPTVDKAVILMAAVCLAAVSLSLGIVLGIRRGKQQN